MLGTVIKDVIRLRALVLTLELILVFVLMLVLAFPLALLINSITSFPLGMSVDGGKQTGLPTDNARLGAKTPNPYNTCLFVSVHIT